MKKYQCFVIVEFSGNEIEAESEQDYKVKLHDYYLQEYNINLRDSEMFDIQEVQGVASEGV